jgi:two-component system chemotaxis sensor kinase CheA
MSKPSLAARLRAAFLGDLGEQLVTFNGALLALEVDPRSADALKIVFRALHTLKGAAHASALPLVARACHHLEATLASARDGETALGPQHFRLLFQAADALADAGRRLARGETLGDDTPIAVLLRALEGSEPVPTAERLVVEDIVVEPPVPAPVAPSPALVQSPPSTTARALGTSDAAVRVAADKLDGLLAQVGRLLTSRSRIAEHAGEVDALQNTIRRSHEAVRRLLATHASSLPSHLASTIREVEFSLRSTKVEGARIAGLVQEDVRDLAEITEGLADSVRRVRMLPVATAYGPLARLVRDVADEVGKPAQLAVRGGDIEADRPVLDAIKEALIHLVRNAIDHGLESPEVRLAARKPVVGTIIVSAALQGDRLKLTVSDDGGGLDIAAIRAKLASQGRPVPASAADVARTLFEAGFSTRVMTTSISGRGVGLDAVEAVLRKVRGTVEVSWVAGQGTTFTLECPLTLAVIRAVLVCSGAHLLALPTSNVERIVRLRASDVRRAEGREVILTDQGPIPLVSLADLLGPPFLRGAPADAFAALIVSAGDRRIAILVETVQAELELVVRPIARGRSELPHVIGGALLGSGQLVIVLNPVSLLQQGLSSRRAVETAVPGARRRVLVADDSLTTRALEQSVLEAAGFEVATAVDGADAWRKLQESGADLLVSDVEMPNMDGYTLCRTVRASARFAHLPVVMVTSLDNADDRARGLAAGADAYVSKGAAGQAGLLEMVRQLLA